ncbi:aminoglycoside phosphotransferase (APT) family kinase protein [Micromonospora pisi]|uniref:Aminoglycoside phosphotransferase (APT) family kinase protein n=1 Tax=Micromonospora pisi TaxID=589240 RepID=A0A495JR59_9ACTN|nr:phosphotransferase family protein [Micromonospora pisi]RKR91018.1 aminoglycoside phosphotransferase (APT) family kinase protein [Micromonospora pisi]
MTVSDSHPAGPTARDTGPPGAPTPTGLDLDRLADHLRAHRPDLLDGALTARLIAGGRSNLTYRVRSGSREFVLRRPPLGHVLATAHDMGREFRVISALAGSGVPVPATLLLCLDPGVTGAPFYLMQWVPGVVFRDRSQTDRLSDAQRRGLALSMMDTLATLHGVDPARVGLADFGRPEGYLARQVRRWGGQLDQSRSRPLPGVTELRERLAASAPEGANAGRIVHGDYRLDNLLAEPAPDPAATTTDRSAAGPPTTAPPAMATIRAVLDWEMATLGDPLADLGLLLTYWDVLGDRDDTAGNPVADGLGPRAGFPSGAELIDRYASRADVDVGPLDWHIALGCFKLAVICEGIHYRHTLGQTVGDGFDRIGEMVQPLVTHGLAAVGRG